MHTTMTHKEFKLKYDGEDYDVANFLRIHPGGINYLKGYEEKEVKEKMEATNHSLAAFSILRNYRVGGRDVKKRDNSEDMEKLVDYSKPLVAQIPSLSENYNDWVQSPVPFNLRLFKSDFMEFFSRTPWYMVPIIWLPAITLMFFIGTSKYIAIHGPDVSYAKPALFYCTFGVAAWTILEYFLHRCLFHFNPGTNKLLILTHFIVHGVHHKSPFDTDRLVFPPAMAVFFLFGFHLLYSILFPQEGIFWMLAGTVLGYVFYDLGHYYLHYGTWLNSYLYDMKRYHNHHHFTKHTEGFGVSSTIWDKVLGTFLEVPKISMTIKWT